MRIGKEIKRDTQLIILSVIILTIVTLSVSYSAFFTVQSLSTIQEISTGNLNVTVTVDNTNSILNNNEELFPSSDSDITNGTSNNYSLLTLLNEGNLDSDFSVTIGYDYDRLRQIDEYKNMTDSELRNHLVSFQYLKIGIYEVKSTNSGWVNFAASGETFYPQISSLTPTSGDAYTYPILRNVVPAKVSTDDTNNVKQYRVYIWLSDETPTSEIGKYVYLKLNVKCAAGNETITETVTGITGTN